MAQFKTDLCMSKLGGNPSQVQARAQQRAIGEGMITDPNPKGVAGAQGKKTGKHVIALTRSTRLETSLKWVNDQNHACRVSKDSTPKQMAAQIKAHWRGLDTYVALPCRNERMNPISVVMPAEDLETLSIPGHTYQTDFPRIVYSPGMGLELQLPEGGGINATRITQEESQDGQLGKFTFEHNGRSYSANSLTEIREHFMTDAQWGAEQASQKREQMGELGRLLSDSQISHVTITENVAEAGELSPGQIIYDKSRNKLMVKHADGKIKDIRITPSSNGQSPPIFEIVVQEGQEMRSQGLKTRQAMFGGAVNQDVSEIEVDFTAAAELYGDAREVAQTQEKREPLLFVQSPRDLKAKRSLEPIAKPNAPQFPESAPHASKATTGRLPESQEHEEVSQSELGSIETRGAVEEFSGDEAVYDLANGSSNQPVKPTYDSASSRQLSAFEGRSNPMYGMSAANAEQAPQVTSEGVSPQAWTVSSDAEEPKNGHQAPDAPPLPARRYSVFSVEEMTSNQARLRMQSEPDGNVLIFKGNGSYKGKLFVCAKVKGKTRITEVTVNNGSAQLLVRSSGGAARVDKASPALFAKSQVGAASISVPVGEESDINKIAQAVIRDIKSRGSDKESPARVSINSGRGNAIPLTFVNEEIQIDSGNATSDAEEPVSRAGSLRRRDFGDEEVEMLQTSVQKPSGVNQEGGQVIGLDVQYEDVSYEAVTKPVRDGNDVTVPAGRFKINENSAVESLPGAESALRFSQPTLESFGDFAIVKNGLGMIEVVVRDSNGKTSQLPLIYEAPNNIKIVGLLPIEGGVQPITINFPATEFTFDKLIKVVSSEISKIKGATGENKTQTQFKFEEVQPRAASSIISHPPLNARPSFSTTADQAKEELKGKPEFSFAFGYDQEDNTKSVYLMYKGNAMEVAFISNERPLTIAISRGVGNQSEYSFKSWEDMTIWLVNEFEGSYHKTRTTEA